LASVLRRRLGGTLADTAEAEHLYSHTRLADRLVLSEHRSLVRLLQENGMPKPSAALIGTAVGDVLTALWEERRSHLSVAGVVDESHVRALVMILRKLASRSGHLATTSRFHLATSAPGAGGAAVSAATATDPDQRRDVAPWQAAPAPRPGPIRSLKVRGGASAHDLGLAGVAAGGRQAAAGLRKDISAVELAVSEAQRLADEAEALLPGMKACCVPGISPRRLETSMGE